MPTRTKLEEMEEALVRYPDFSPYILLKLSMVRYGAVLTDAALDQLQSPLYSFGSLEPFGIDFEGRPAGRSMPGAILLRDATNVYINYGETYDNPYVVDWDSDRNAFVLKEGDTLIDLVDFVPRPAFFGKRTSKGTPMEAVADVRAQKLILTAFQRCRLWEGGNQCGFCAFFTGGHSLGEVDCGDICETVEEALKGLPNVVPNTKKEATKYLQSESNYSRLLKDDKFWNREKSDKLTYHMPMNHREATIKRFEMLKQGESLKNLFEKYSGKELEQLQTQRILPKKMFIKRNYRLKEKEPSPTVTSHCLDEFVHPRFNRALTVRECARLQSFPDSYDFCGGPYLVPHLNRTVQDKYEQIGDAVPPLLAYAWGREIKKIMEQV